MGVFVGMSAVNTICWKIFLLLLLSSYTKAGLPARLVIEGSQILDPQTGDPVTLHGVNWWSGYFQSDDGLDLETQLPGANLVRLVGILWDNGNPNTDCRTWEWIAGYEIMS